MIILNGVELELDILDAQTAERYENAIEFLQTAPKTTGKKMSEIIKSESAGAREFLSILFGEGVGEKIIPKDNFEVAFNTIVNVIDEFKKQSEKVDKLKQRVNKYSPNRAERRA